MRRWLLVASAPLVTVLLATGSAAAGAASGGANAPRFTAAAPAAGPTFATQLTHRPIPKQVIRAGAKLRPGALSRLMSPQTTQIAPLTAHINVSYVNFPANARAAFQAAVNIWETKIYSAVPIDVTADWSDLGDPSILGSAGPSDFVENFTNAPHPGVFYPIALANAIAGSDQLLPTACSADGNAPGAEIEASFNSAFSSWYYGTDGMPPSNDFDLESVVLHELGHGLGFVGTYDGLDPTTGNDTGNGYFGLTGNGTLPTIFDTFATDGSGTPLASYGNATQALGGALRGNDGGVEWNGAQGMSAAGGTRPVLYAPGPSDPLPDNRWEEGSSFSHLDETTYPTNNANSLMTPFLSPHEVTHDPGPILLGMFADMGWPQSAGAPDISVGEYHALTPVRLAAATAVTSGTPVTVTVAGTHGVPPQATAVAVNVEVKSPTGKGYWTVLPGCTGGPGKPDTQDYYAGQTRLATSILPVDDNGRIRVWISGGSAAVNVDLLGYYGSNAGGTFYHHLQGQQVAGLVSIRAGAPVSVPVAGKAGVPSSGVTAVTLKLRMSAGTSAGWLFAGPGHVTPAEPISAYAKGEMISTLDNVPVSGDGAVGLGLSAGTATVSMEAVGWYGPSASGGQVFHPAGPARYQQALRGQDVTVSGLPVNAQVMLDVHLANPTAAGWLGSAPAGHPTLHGVQEYRTGTPVSGTIVTTTNTTGQVRLHLSAGISTMYVDYQGWFAAG